MALLSRSTIVTLALATGLVFAAGTGGAVAGALITGKQIKDGTVTTADIRNGSLTGVDVKDGSIAGLDVRDGSITGTDVTDYSLGAADIKDEVIGGVKIQNGSLGPADIADGSLTGNELQPHSLGPQALDTDTANQYADRGVSGTVSKAGILAVHSAPGGATVDLTFHLNGFTGQWCIKVTGGRAGGISPQTATLVASPDFSADSTDVGTDYQAFVETTTGTTSGCTGGFRVMTFANRNGDVVASDEPFVFQIN